jgi:hypothetical protein
MSMLDVEFVSRYARVPSPTTVAAAVSAHTSIRDLLGDKDYFTFLQGSYKNDTALADMNDVDIVAVDRRLVSRVHSGRTGLSGSGTAWSDIFGRIETKLQDSHHYRGKWKREDKCIRVNTGIRVDIVPAVVVTEAGADPIALYSFAGQREKINWPRGHYEGATRKSQETNGTFKQQVRLFKRWARCWFGGAKIAPSYYIECALHACPNSEFTGHLAEDFLRLAARLITWNHTATRLPRIAGSGELLSSEEWTVDNFVRFQAQLLTSTAIIRDAVVTHDAALARTRWVSAFNGYTG